MSLRQQLRARPWRVPSLAARHTLATITVACSFLLSCAPNPQTVWSTTETSPDGQWIAGAHTQGWSGPGIGAAESSVYLERTRGSRQTREPQDVISYPEVQDKVLPQIKWLSASLPKRKSIWISR
jgi:hypothetical protein